MTQSTPDRALDELASAAIHAVNAAIQAGQTSLIDEIRQDYLDAVVEHLLTGSTDGA